MLPRCCSFQSENFIPIGQPIWILFSDSSSKSYRARKFQHCQCMSYKNTKYEFVLPKKCTRLWALRIHSLVRSRVYCIYIYIYINRFTYINTIAYIIFCIYSTHICIYIYIIQAIKNIYAIYITKNIKKTTYVKVKPGKLTK